MKQGLIAAALSVVVVGLGLLGYAADFEINKRAAKQAIREEMSGLRMEPTTTGTNISIQEQRDKLRGFCPREFVEFVSDAGILRRCCAPLDNERAMKCVEWTP